MGYDGETRGVAEIGRSIMKTVADLSKVRADVPQPAPEPTSVATPANDATMVSMNVEMSGTLVSPDALHVAGKIYGNVRASTITVGATGFVKGDVVADLVIVHGTVEGRIYGASVKLASGAQMTGDIFHGALGIDSNATFEGSSRRLADVMAEAPMFMAESEAA